MSDDNEKKEGGKGMTIQQAIKIINPDTGDWELQRIEREGYKGLVGKAAGQQAYKEAIEEAIRCMELVRNIESDDDEVEPDAEPECTWE